MRKLFRVQADLFVTSVRAAELIGIERQKAVSTPAGAADGSGEDAGSRPVDFRQGGGGR